MKVKKLNEKKVDLYYLVLVMVQKIEKEEGLKLGVNEKKLDLEEELKEEELKEEDKKLDLVEELNEKKLEEEMKEEDKKLEEELKEEGLKLDKEKEKLEQKQESHQGH
jgi:hypothetical protein